MSMLLLVFVMMLSVLMMLLNDANIDVVVGVSDGDVLYWCYCRCCFQC